jgi:hypothetical protein
MGWKERDKNPLLCSAGHQKWFAVFELTAYRLLVTVRQTETSITC